jgi:hypothetical protein
MSREMRSKMEMGREIENMEMWRGGEMEIRREMVDGDEEQDGDGDGDGDKDGVQ